MIESESLVMDMPKSIQLEGIEGKLVLSLLRIFYDGLNIQHKDPLGGFK
jgi:hypothetical protein